MGYQGLKFSPETMFLVTGGAGFIGSNLCETLLKFGVNVRCLDNFSMGNKKNIAPFLKNKKFELIEGDIRQIETCQKACCGVTFVLHQAAWGSVPRSITMPLEYTDNNIRGTQNILDAALYAGVKRVIYASSSSVFGNSEKMPKKEGEEGEALSPYALTKQVNEKTAKLYTSLFGLETIGLRYFNVFGRCQNPQGSYAAVIPKFIQAIFDGTQPMIYGDGMQQRDFTYIDHVIEANLKACLTTTENCGEVFNIAGGQKITLLALLGQLEKIIGKKITPQFLPSRKGDILYSYADISKAQEKLSYHPEIDFATGLRKTFEWYQQNRI